MNHRILNGGIEQVCPNGDMRFNFKQADQDGSHQRAATHASHTHAEADQYTCQNKLNRTNHEDMPKSKKREYIMTFGNKLLSWLMIYLFLKQI